MQMNRRQAVHALGWGGATLLVGCNTTPIITPAPTNGELSSGATVTDCTGTITLGVKLKSSITDVIKVEFYQGKTLLGTITAAPYSLDIPAQSVVTKGGGDSDDSENETEYERHFTAKIYLKSGKAFTTEKIMVTIKKDCTTTPDTTPPTVSLAASSSNVTAAGKVTLTATAADNVGVSKVEFYEGAALLGTKTAAPYIFDLNFAAADNGTHNYIAKAFDVANNSATSSPSVTVVVNIGGAPSDTTAPTVGLSSSSLSVTAAGSIVLTASAADNVGVTKVEFYEGGTLLGTKTAAPYTQSVAFTSANNGTHNYTAKAYDAANNSASSTPAVAVVVNIGQPADTTPPTVSLSSSSLSVTAAGSITLTATASDNVGVTKVEFYDGATLIGTKTAAPYTQSVAFTDANNGTHNYTATAYDAAGNTKASTPATAVVVNIPAPTTGTKVAALTDFPSVGSWKDFAGPLGSDVGGLVYRSSAPQTGGITVNGMNLIAFSRHCTHQGCDVLDLGPDATHTLTCPCHGATFNLESGAAQTLPAKSPLPKLVIKAFADGIYLQ